MSYGDALRSPQFIILVLTNFFCCATHSGPIFHTVSYAVTCGIPLVAAVSIYSVEGLAGMGGRVAFGLMGDKFGAKRILVLGLLVQAIATLAYLYASGLASFYAAAALFGFIYAGVMPLYSVLARENFPLRMMGTVIGGTTMAGGLGMATGPVVGGLIYDSFASYAWLFILSFGLGIASVLVALTFKPFPKGEAVPAVRNCLERRLSILQIEGMSEVDVSDLRGRRDVQQFTQQSGEFAVRAVVGQKRAVRSGGNADGERGRLG